MTETTQVRLLKAAMILGVTRSADGQERAKDTEFKD